MKGDGIAAPALAFGWERQSVRDQRGRFGGEGNFSCDCQFAGRVETHITEARRGAVHSECEGVPETIAHIRSPARETIAPSGKIEALLFSELHIDATLTDTLATHAREICLAADLEREAAVQDVIPHVPLGDARRVHRADEIARAMCDAHANLHGAHSIHLGHGKVG